VVACSGVAVVVGGVAQCWCGVVACSGVAVVVGAVVQCWCGVWCGVVLVSTQR